MAEETEFTQIWADAFGIYKEKTGRDIKTDPTLRLLRTTDDLLLQVEQREHRFDSFRSKKSKLWSVLRSCMKPVELLGGLTQGALTLTPFSPASTVLGAVLFLVGSAHGVSEAYDCITDLLSQLEDFTGRLQEYTRGEIDSKLRKKLTAILTTLLEIFARSEKLIRQGRIKQYLLVTFLGSNEKVAAAMGRLKALTDTEEKLVISLTYSTTQRTDKTVERTEGTVERTEKTIEGMVSSMSDSKRDAKEEAERKMVKEALDSTALVKVREIYGEVSDRRLPGTGEWIKEESLYQEWMERKTPILWILGGPGAGKSFLSSNIISHLQDTHPQDPQHPSRVSLGYFYIKEDNQVLRDLNTILKSIAYQIASADSVYQKFVANVCSTPEKISSPKGAWERLFIDFFGSPQYRDSSTFIVIDGLDEAPKDQREKLLVFLKSLEDNSDQSTRPRIQIALVGRPELHDDISSVWDERIIFIEVSARKNTADIANYIAAGIHKVRALKNDHISAKIRIELRKVIVDRLTEGANGMFLWVNLVLDQICKKSRPSDITAALNEAPRDLGNMIRHVFERLAAAIEHVEKEDLNEMLAWVTCAQRPLLLGELDLVLKLRPPIGEGVPDLEDRLRGQFASFFTLTREDNLTTEDLQRRVPQDAHLKRDHNENKGIQDENVALAKETEDILDAEDGFESDPKSTILQFSHASIRDYLVQEGKPETRKWVTDELGIGIEMNKVHLHITETCLSILCNKDHGSDFEAPNLTDYAADYFMNHLILIDRSKLNDIEKRDILHSLYLLFHDDSIIERWFDSTTEMEETFIRTLLGNCKYLQCIRKWFTEAVASNNTFNSEQCLWIQEAAKSDTVLLRPMAMLCSARWLTSKGIDLDPTLYVLFLHVYLNLAESGKGDDDKKVDLDQLRTKHIRLARLRQLANFAELERTVFWHSRLAKVMREANYIDAAIPEFFIAIQKDKQYWGSREGLALCYEARKDYAMAIQWELEAIALIPEKEMDMVAIAWQDVGKWSLEMGDKEGAIKASKKAHKLKCEDIWAMNTYITALDVGGSLDEVLEFAESLDKSISTTTSESLLTELLLISNLVTEMLGNAARARGKLDFVLRAIETAVAVAKRRNDPYGVAYQRYVLGVFKFRHANCKEEAMDIWEYVLESTANSKDLWEYYSLLSFCSDQLSQLYFSNAVAAEKEGGRPEYWISKLESLCKHSKSADSEDGVFETKNASLVLGLWYNMHGRTKEAKACFRAKILEGIDILSDEDPENDLWGYTALAEALLIAGDMTNAAAAFAVTLAPVDRRKALQQAKLKSEKQATAETEDPENMDISDKVGKTLSINEGASGNSVDVTTEAVHPKEDDTQQDPDAMDYTTLCLYNCDGKCTRKPEEWTALHFCRVCLQTCFCDVCFELLKTDKLPFRKCDVGHPFYQAYPIAENPTEVARMVVESKLVPHAEWLQKLREEWVE